MNGKEKSKELMQRIEQPNFKYRTVLGSSLTNAEEIEKKHKQHNISEYLKVCSKRLEKLFLLMEFYDIDENDNENRWFKLAYNLALTHETGFKISLPSGSKKKWDSLQLLGLVATIKLMIIHKPMSISNACQIIKDKNFSGQSTTKKTIENKYGEALKNKLVNGVLYMTTDPKTGISNLEALTMAAEMFRPEKL